MEKKEKEIEQLKHKNRMEEIETKRKAEIEVENLKFNHALELQRIKAAEIRKSIDRKQNKEFMEHVIK